MFHKFKLNSTKYIILPSISYSDEEIEFINNCWNTEKKKKPNLHNGLGYAMINISDDPLTITLGPTDYKSNIAAVNYNPTFRCYSRIATSIILREKDKIFLGKRNVNVGTFAGVYNHFGGLVDFHKNLEGKDFADYLLAETLRELSEEVELDSYPDRTKLEFLGMNVTYDKYITDFFFTYNSKPVKIIDAENTEIKEIKIANLVNNTLDIEVSPILLEAIKVLEE